MTEDKKMPEWQQKNLEGYLDIAFKHDKLDRHKVEFIKRYCDNPETVSYTHLTLPTILLV